MQSCLKYDLLVLHKVFKLGTEENEHNRSLSFIYISFASPSIICCYKIEMHL